MHVGHHKELAKILSLKLVDWCHSWFHIFGACHVLPGDALALCTEAYWSRGSNRVALVVLE